MPHQWVEPTKLVRWPHCRVCGIIKRRDGKNSPECKGMPKVLPRSASEVGEGL